MTAFQALLGDYRTGFQADEPAGLERWWRAFAARDRASPELWMDAYLAAFAVSGEYRLVTTDRGFAQFPHLDQTILGR